jgi:hypothetical protein
MPVVDLEFATTTRTGTLLQWLRADAAKIRNGSPSAEWPHPSLAAFVLAHGRAFATGDIGSSQRRLARWLAATHWRVHGPFQHREPALNAQRCLFLDELERFVYSVRLCGGFRAGRRCGPRVTPTSAPWPLARARKPSTHGMPSSRRTARSFTGIARDRFDLAPGFCGRLGAAQHGLRAHPYSSVTPTTTFVSYAVPTAGAFGDGALHIVET